MCLGVHARQFGSSAFLLLTFNNINMKTLCLIVVITSFILTVLCTIAGNFVAAVANFNLVLVWLMLHYFIRKGYLKSHNDN